MSRQEGDAGPKKLKMLSAVASWWLGNLDSNQDKQSQSLLCYRYTIPQDFLEQFQPLEERSEAATQVAFCPAASLFYPLHRALGKSARSR